MRTRNEILTFVEGESKKYSPKAVHDVVILELLLDIRDLLIEQNENNTVL